jgi:hypothetical protein
MSSRFHNKWHRHNHHTISINDPNYPDASHDPIASPESPFQGDFILQGGLSASGNIEFTGIMDFKGIVSLQTFETPVTSTGEFLYVTFNNQPRLIRLWNF